MHNAQMSLTAQHNWKTQLGILLILAAQVISIAHASEFGAGPHEHNGVICIAVVTDEPEGILPAGAITEPALNAAIITVLSTSAKTAFVERGRTIRPPSTGPPSL